MHLQTDFFFLSIFELRVGSIHAMFLFVLMLLVTRIFLYLWGKTLVMRYLGKYFQL